jgi:hypothetical protein
MGVGFERRGILFNKIEGGFYLLTSFFHCALGRFEPGMLQTIIWYKYGIILLSDTNAYWTF